MRIRYHFSHLLPYVLAGLLFVCLAIIAPLVNQAAAIPLDEQGNVVVDPPERADDDPGAGPAVVVPPEEESPTEEISDGNAEASADESGVQVDEQDEASRESDSTAATEGGVDNNSSGTNAEVAAESEDTEVSDDSEDEEITGDNCTNQTGAVGWIICPTTGVVANAADALYNVIENFLVVDPTSFNQESPVYSIWDYCRAITNLVFVIVILIVIFAQVTGVGLNSYNMKKTLPRIIVVAILINLSFIIASLLVDLSNIIGSNLKGFFDGVTESLIAGSGYSAETYSIGNIAAAVISGTAIAGVEVGLVAAGGVAAFFWMLVPVIFGAIISIVSGLITIAMRQAVVVLLVMVAPLAIVAYALPNTERLFSKWKHVLVQMLTFYPVFSFLFGASRLLGVVFVMSATNVYGIILGVAVQVFPLFFAFKFMKMSGTALGTINAKLNALGQKVVRPAQTWANSHRELARARHSAVGRGPNASLNRFLEERKVRRVADTTQYQEFSKKRYGAYAANIYNEDGQLTRRGERFYRMSGEKLIYEAETKRLQAELNEAGFRDDGTDKRIRSGEQRRRIAEINKELVRGVDLTHAADSFVESAKTANAASYAKRTEQAREKIIEIRNDQKLTDAEKSILIDRVDHSMARTLRSVADPQDRTQYMNNIFANAISDQTKADRVIRDNYAQLYAATELTRNIHADFNRSFADKNYNAMEAAIDELAKRGDFDLIRESLIEHTGEIVGEKNVEMQKHLADTLIKYKSESAPLWAYAKATNIRRAKHANDPDNVALFTTYKEFETGAVPQGYTAESGSTTHDLSMSYLVKTINDPGVAMRQDRTTFKYLLRAQQAGNLRASDMGFAIKQLRSAASSGQIDGEQLANLNLLMAGGIVTDAQGNLDTTKMKQGEVDFVQQNRSTIEANIVDYTENMSAKQLASMKESTFVKFNQALMYLLNDGKDYGTGIMISERLYNALYANAANNMSSELCSSMNTNIKNWLGIENNIRG